MFFYRLEANIWMEERSHGLVTAAVLAATITVQHRLRNVSPS